MPDSAIEREFSERPAVPLDRPAIHAGLGYHPYQESEFPSGAGHCDQCGGGPLAEIHQKPADNTARIADALERIAAVLENSCLDILPDGGAVAAMKP